MSNFDKIKEILVEKIGVEEAKITENASLIEDLGADSLDAVEVVMDLETEFDITIGDDEAQSLKTVKDIVSIVDKKLEGK